MVEPILLSQLTAATGGELFGENITFSSVSIDSRTIKKGDLYIALKGEKFDGHQFIKAAVKNECSAFLVNDGFELEDASLKEIPHIVVSDTLKALGLCGQLNRKNFDGVVVGLTGSAGKTSTKNMLESVLSEKGSTYATHGNFNNEVGVPLSLLNIGRRHQYAVIEMGARRQGDIKYLSNLVDPNVAILLNAGSAHIEVFGSQQNIVRGKGEIFTALNDDGLAVVNADDPAKQIWLDSLLDKKVLTFSLNDTKADVFASNIQTSSDSSRFLLNHLAKAIDIKLPVPGVHNIANSLAVAAAAIHLGFSLSQIASGLARLSGTSGRLMTIPCSESLVVIDDSYNANLSSMKAAIDVLSLREGFKIAVLGEMTELGDFSQKLHLDLARYISDSHVDKVYLIGAYALEMSKLIGERSSMFQNKGDIFQALSENDTIFENNKHSLASTSVLVKGSRSTAMNELVDMIVEKAAH